MAFDVTPTSGSAPYTFTATFLNKSSFGSEYRLRFHLSPQSEGVCLPPESAVTNIIVGANALLENGVYVRETGTVPNGNCVTYRLTVLDSIDQVIDMKFVTVSNV